MSKLILRLLLCSLLGGFIFNLPVEAITINELINQKKLSLNVRMQTEGAVIARQPVTLEIDVATQRWFAKGVRVMVPNVANAVMLPISGLGINSTRKIKGETWASQMREITLYPIKVGKYTIPPIAVSVSVNTEKFGIVEGQVFTEPLTFDVEIPAELKSLDYYIVSPEVELIIDGDPAADKIFAVGEALGRTITLTASDVPAMMLPTIAKTEVEGLSIYHKPPQLDDRSSRGSLTGTRTETFTYIFEKAGKFKVPEQKNYWWNLSTKKLTELLIPAMTLLVSGEMVAENQVGKEKYLTFRSLKKRGYFMILLSGFFFVYLWYRYRIRLFALYSKLTNLPYRLKRKAFIQAIKRAEYRLACQILYQIIDLSNRNACCLKRFFDGQPRKLAILDKLLSNAYNSGIKNFEITVADAKLLLAKSSGNRRQLENNFSGENLTLNPKT